MDRASGFDPKNRTLKPWLFALLIVLSLILVALAAVLLAHILISGQQMEYYYGIFKISQPQVHRNTGKRSSYQLKELQGTSEHLVDEMFIDSTLNKHYINNQEVRPIPEDEVKVDSVTAFQIPSTVIVIAREKKIPSNLHQKIRKTRALPANVSSVQANGCGKRVAPLIVNRIMSGELAAKGAWPWQASLQRGNIHQCGATLISNMWLVTAAHCFKSNANPRQWTVSFGTTIKPPLMKREVRRIIVHERYRSPSREYDIAVLQITPRLTFSDDVRPICLPGASATLRSNSTVYITGFGALYYGGESQNNLREARVKIISNAVCKQPHVYGNDIKFGMFCAGFLEGIYDACRGDSGGPLVIRDPNNTWYLMGIVSWGDNCGQKNKPGVYTQVTYYRRWIASRTGI
ncbi:transmembrane protease serine 11A [Thomomys bottae]